MLHPFRSALLVFAALSAATVAPAQVRPAAANEPLISGTNELPATVVPATFRIGSGRSTYRGRFSDESFWLRDVQFD